MRSPAPSPSAVTAARETRGIWVSYTELEELLRGKSPDAAGAAIDGMMRSCADAGLNTVFFHARANADAYYPSDLYPAAEGVAALLKQGFDPLARAVEAAHKQRLRLHAWINPYRAGDAAKKEKDTFVWQQRAYYPPHSAAAQKRIVDGVREIVGRYPVDGVQFDDYFYPEGSVPADKPADFEKEAFAAAQKEEPSLAVGDWRRQAVDGLIRQVWSAVHSRAGCVFGVSPSHDAAKNRDRMYADVTGWMTQSGTVDYVCPQIYFGFEHETVPFHEIVDLWRQYPRREGVALYVGLALYKAGAEDPYAGSGKDEWLTHDNVIARSVNWLHTRSGVDGFSLFSWRHLSAAKKETAALKKVLR